MTITKARRFKYTSTTYDLIEKYRIFSLVIILILTPDFPNFYYMLGGNLGSLLYGEVSGMLQKSSPEPFDQYPQNLVCSRWLPWQYIYIYVSVMITDHNSFFKERSGREGMTVVSVLLGAAVAVGVGSNPTIAK